MRKCEEQCDNWYWKRARKGRISGERHIMKHDESSP